MTGEIIDQTVEAIILELERSPWRGTSAKTIFFGGGTPTFLSEKQLTRLLHKVLEIHPPVPGCEITSEANPGTVDMPKFAAMVQAGFNRISLGAQSFEQSDLLTLGRVHEPSHIARAVAMAREAGFRNLNLDLMFALPGQSRKAWSINLQTAIDLKPDHLSLYCLTIEPNTRYYRLNLRGMLDLPDDEVQREMYEEAVTKSSQFGYRQYEISNFAQEGKECQHNLCYWRNECYYSYGPGAVGCFEDQEGRRLRYTNMKHPSLYVEAISLGKKLWCDEDLIDPKTSEFEQIMLGIRLNSGLDVSRVSVDTRSIKTLVRRGWVTHKENYLFLTPEGRHFCSEVALLLSPN
jgi:oxygen-independent coproporphyrinogen-3 oxidase